MRTGTSVKLSLLSKLWMPLYTRRDVVVHTCKTFCHATWRRHDVVMNFKVQLFGNFLNIFCVFAIPYSNIGEEITNIPAGIALPLWRCIRFLVINSNLSYCMLMVRPIRLS